MYRVRVSLNNFVNNIDRILSINVIKQYLQKLNIDPNIRILIGDKAYDMNKNRLGDLESNSNLRDEYVKATYTEVSTENEELSLELINPDYKKILKDNNMYIDLTPVYHKRTATISITYISKSKSKINQIVNKLRVMPTTTSQLSYNDIEYYYNLPNYITLLLSHMVYLRNQRFPEDEQITLEEYVNENFTRGDYAINLSAQYLNSNFVIREHQVNVVGLIDNDLHNIEAEYIDESSSWGVTIDYKFNYERPVFIDATYPMLCYNQLLDKRFRLVNKTKEVIEVERAKGYQALVDANKAYEDVLKYMSWNGSYFHYPKEDIEVLPKPTINAKRILTVMTVIDPNEPNTIMSLKEIPGIQFTDDILKVLALESDYISEPYESIFYFELYNNKSKLYNKLYIEKVYDDDDNVIDYLLKSVEPIPINYVIRVSVSIVYNMNYIITNRFSNMVKNFESVNPEYIDEYRMYPKTLYKVLGIFNVNENIVNYDLTELDFEPYLNMKTNLISIIETIRSE